MSKIYKKQAGVTLIELMVVLVIGAILVYFLWPVARGWWDTASRSNLSSARDSYIQCVNERLTSYPSTSVVNSAWAISRGCVAQSRVSTAGAIKNPEGGVTTIAAATIASADDAISISDSGLSATLCASYSADKSDQYDAIWVNGTQVKSPGSALDDSGVTSKCSKDDKTNVVTFAKFKS